MTSTTTLVQHAVPLLVVADVQRSVEFYRRLGFEEEPSATPDHPDGTALRSGQAELLLVARQQTGALDPGTGGLVLHVGDLLAVRDRLTVSGVQMDNLVVDGHAVHGELIAHDPDGHLLVVRPVPHDAGSPRR